MSQKLVAMQSRLCIFEYHRPDRLLRSNSEFVIVASSADLEPHRIIGIGPKSRGDEDAAPDDLRPIHVMVGTRVGGHAGAGPAIYLLNRFLPLDLDVPSFFGAAQFFPADGIVEFPSSDVPGAVSVVGRHAHMRGEHDTALEVTERGMRSRRHIEGRVDDTRFALAWTFTATPLPWPPAHAAAA
jgi:hypothetical protein